MQFLGHVQPVTLEGAAAVEGLRLAHLETTEDGSLVASQGAEFTLPVKMVVLAIGQSTHTDFLAKQAALKLERGRIVIDRATGQTSVAKIFAGGDCTNGGREVVDAVADGKRAGLGIVVYLSGKMEAHRAGA